MFGLVDTIETEVFARLPDTFRLPDRPANNWVTVQRRGAPIGSFLEGPSFDRAGNLYVVDVAHGRIFRVDTNGVFSLVTEYDGEPNGLKIHRDGRIFVADHKLGILVVDPATGGVEVVCDRPNLERFKGVNDLVFASNGDLYFTDQGQTGLQDPSGRVYRLSADGQLTMLMDGIPSPNGIVLDESETAVFVAVTRANSVWRLPLMVDGMPSKVGLYLQLSGGVGPDGMAADTQGNLCVCHPGLGTVWVFDKLGELRWRVRSCADTFTTNAAFGGQDNDWLYITESHDGVILRAKMPYPGRRMYSHHGAV